MSTMMPINHILFKTSKVFLVLKTTFNMYKNDVPRLFYHQANIICAEGILGTNLGSLKGKTARKIHLT